MSGWHLLVVLDVLAAAGVGFWAGLMLGRHRGHRAGFRAGLAWGGQLAAGRTDRARAAND